MSRSGDRRHDPSVSSQEAEEDGRLYRRSHARCSVHLRGPTAVLETVVAQWLVLDEQARSLMVVRLCSPSQSLELVFGGPFGCPQTSQPDEQRLPKAHVSNISSKVQPIDPRI